MRAPGSFRTSLCYLMLAGFARERGPGASAPQFGDLIRCAGWRGAHDFGDHSQL
jgi:hypothetical protein